MRTFLYIYLVLNIIAAIIGSIAVLFTSPLTALIYIPLVILNIIPIFAIISNLESIEQLKSDFYKLKCEIKSNKVDTDNEYNDIHTAPAVNYEYTADNSWQCVKCATVNKSGTNHCSNCYTAFSPDISTTSDIAEKKKISRFIKFK